MFNQHAPILAALYPGEDPLDLFLSHFSSKYESTMTRIAKATVNKPELVSLVIQNTLLHIAKYPNIQQNIVKLEGDVEEQQRYIYSIVYSRCTDLLKGECAFDYVDLGEMAETLPGSVSTEEVLIDREHCQEIYDFIDTLTTTNRCVMLLLLDGYSNQEIAESLGISEATVRKRVSRVRAMLSEWLAKRVS